jgi:hypothetical protein
VLVEGVERTDLKLVLSGRVGDGEIDTPFRPRAGDYAELAGQTWQAVELKDDGRFIVLVDKSLPVAVGDVELDDETMKAVIAMNPSLKDMRVVVGGVVVSEP